MIDLIYAVLVLLALFFVLALPAIRHARRVEAACFDVIADSRHSEAAAVRAARESGALKLEALRKAHADRLIEVQTELTETQEDLQDTLRECRLLTSQVQGLKWARAIDGASFREHAQHWEDMLRAERTLTGCLASELEDREADLEASSSLLSWLRLDHEAECRKLTAWGEANQEGLDRASVVLEAAFDVVRGGGMDRRAARRAKRALQDAGMRACFGG